MCKGKSMMERWKGSIYRTNKVFWHFLLRLYGLSHAHMSDIKCHLQIWTVGGQSSTAVVGFDVRAISTFKKRQLQLSATLFTCETSEGITLLGAQAYDAIMKTCPLKIIISSCHVLQFLFLPNNKTASKVDQCVSSRMDNHSPPTARLQRFGPAHCHTKAWPWWGG